MMENAKAVCNNKVQRRNANGKLFLDLCKENNLIVGEQFFNTEIPTSHMESPITKTWN